MKRPVFSFRPNMDHPEHKRAWEILERVPNGQKSAFLVRAILQFDNQEELRRLIRESVQEGMEGRILTHLKVEEKNEDIPGQMLSFLEELQG